MSLPDCMMPDGGEACIAYHEAVQRISELEQENHRYREALEAIIKHYKVIAPTAMEYSATYHIAKKALEAGE